MGENREDKDGSGKVWCAIILIAVLAVIVVVVVLALTVFRVRDPQITVQSFQIRSFSLTFLNDGPHLSFIMDVVVAVKNRNHASFKYQDSTAYVYYHGASVGNAMVPAGKVGAEKTTTIGTTFNIDSSAFVGSPYISGDVQTGTIPLLVTTTLPGQIDVAGIVKHHATSVANCNLNVYVQTQSVGNVNCNYKLHL